MGFLSDFKKANKQAQRVRSAAKDATPSQRVASRDRAGKIKVPDPVFADDEEFAQMPILTLRAWDYGRGLDPDTNGFGFTASDGRIWAARNCKWELWPDLGVLVINTIGTPYHLEDLTDPSFNPGKPIRLVAEPENPHSEGGTAIAVRNWANDRTAGYVKSGNTSRLRNLLRGTDFHVMSLSARYAASEDDPTVVQRTHMKYVVWRPGRLRGCDHVPLSPQIEDAPNR